MSPRNDSQRLEVGQVRSDLIDYIASTVPRFGLKEVLAHWDVFDYPARQT